MERTSHPEPDAAPRPRVLVAFAGPELPHQALGAGRLIARAIGAPLHGVLVWPTPIAPRDVPRLLQIDAELLEGMVLDVDVGDPAERISAATRSQPVAFLVLVAAGSGGDACGLGEVAARLLEGSGAGAVILRPGTWLGPIRRILVPIDGTPSTAAALAPAGDLARRTGAALDVVMVDDVTAPIRPEPGTMAPPHYVDQPQHEWPAFSAELVQRTFGSIAQWPPTVPMRLLLGTGKPAAEILRFAEELDPDLIALVWHGGADGHGAVFAEVTRGTTRPLLVLRC